MKKIVTLSLFSLSLAALMPLSVQAQDTPVVGQGNVAPVQETVAPDAPQVSSSGAPEAVLSVTEMSTDEPAPAPINPDIAPDVAIAPPADGGVTTMPAAPLPTVLGTPVEKEINEQIQFQNPGVDPSAMPSLFFSVWEHDLIIDARNTLNTRPPDDVSPENNAVAVDSPRDVVLGGIVYVSSKEWTIWLNEKRVTPDAIPNEVMDLKVYKDHIELEWFDATNNQIFPIRLRTKQRFNLDTRMFLPG